MDVRWPWAKLVKEVDSAQDNNTGHTTARHGTVAEDNDGWPVAGAALMVETMSRMVVRYSDVHTSARKVGWLK
jgi:hypothetical protein